MKSFSLTLTVLSLCAVVLSTTSCLGPQISPELAAKIEAAEEEVEKTRVYEEPPHLPGTYEYFVTHHDYPTTMEVFRDEQLLAQAGGKSPIYICLEQQRGRLYVDDRVAADWPVSTGIDEFPTKTGTYRVIEKKENYASNLYGNIKDANGKVVKRNATADVDPIPEGGSFVGSPMPYWHRLTWAGLGMHVGNVKAGKRLSHGCIRTPKEMAKELYGITTFRTKVHIVDELEDCYPARNALLNGVGYQEAVRRFRAAEAKLAKLQEQAEEEIAAQLRAKGKKVPAKKAKKKKEEPKKAEPKKVEVVAPQPQPQPVMKIRSVQSVMPGRDRESVPFTSMPLPR